MALKCSETSIEINGECDPSDQYGGKGTRKMTKSMRQRACPIGVCRGDDHRYTELSTPVSSRPPGYKHINVM